MDIQPSLVLFVLVASITPGPNNIMIMTSALNHGVRASVPHVLGIVLGFPALLLAVGFGLGYVFDRYTWLHQIIQAVGICYLLYLAYLIATTKTARISEPASVASKPLTFFQAALFQWVNPKAWIMGTSALATYSTVGADPVWQIIGIVLVFFVFTFPAVATWLIFGLALQRLLSSEDYRTWFNWLMAVLLLVSILPSLRELLIALL